LYNKHSVLSVDEIIAAISEHRSLKHAEFNREVIGLLKTDMPAATAKLNEVYMLAAQETLPQVAFSWGMTVEVNVNVDGLQEFMAQQEQQT